MGEIAQKDGLMTLVGRTDPDVVVLSQDIASDSDGAIVSWLSGEVGTAVILVAVSSGGPTVWRGISNGAVGYLLKDRLVTELEPAISAAEAGGVFVSPPLVKQMVRYMDDRFGEVGQVQQGVGEILRSLLPREQETLYRLAAGQSTEEIAKEMSIAVPTVRAYVSRILTKLGLRSRGEAVALAFRSGFYTSDQVKTLTADP
ncbi:response regulator transcription factor [Streptomyces sp. SudanB182_2057]|uniref:response regulator transcription factor n=1 Tax=Streptomyces sp. SudanB182_2057 TaxID=3035281 RepID=UPI003F544D9F